MFFFHGFNLFIHSFLALLQMITFIKHLKLTFDNIYIVQLLNMNH